jgi:4-hydroxy-2-oxoheptanedioate aldolase
VIGSVGFDWLCIDLQHGVATEANLTALLQAATAVGVPALVRPASADAAAIGRALDSGAAGVVVPLVEDVAAAEAVVSACRYPPRGRRSWGPFRPLVDGSPSPDTEPLCVVMVETAVGVGVVEQIASVSDVDVVFVGPTDLSLSLGGDRADVGAALARIAAACRNAHTPAGIACADAAHVVEAHADGYQLLTVQWDVGFLVSGAASALSSARAAIGAA